MGTEIAENSGLVRVAEEKIIEIIEGKVTEIAENSELELVRKIQAGIKRDILLGKESMQEAIQHYIIAIDHGGTKAEEITRTVSQVAEEKTREIVPQVIREIVEDSDLKFQAKVLKVDLIRKNIIVQNLQKDAF